MQLREAMQKSVLIMDGAMGTMLQNAGLKAGENPNLLNLTNPEAVENVHLAYISAGARMILTNTFGANERKLGSKAREMVAQGVAIAKRAAKETGTYVALDVGPLGELLAPMGQLSFHEAYEIFKNQMLAGAEASADAIYIETITDLAEARCALLAAKENTDLPVICSMSFEKNMRTFMGVSLASMALCLGGLGADGLGINCSVGPKEIYPMVEELQRWTTLPLAVKPNAGLPTVVDGETIYQTTAEAFEKEMQKIAGLGVFALGGCCGTTPAFIRRLSPLAGSFRSARQKETPAAVCSSAQVVCFDEFKVVGDRISPAGAEIRNAIEEQDLDTLVDEALSQVDDGADLIGVEVGIPGVDEAETMREAVSTLQSMTSAPLCLISGDLAALEAGLRQYHGKAMIYVPYAAEAKREDLWRLAGKYGAAVMVSVAE
ncbi:MAG TPA: homocysteine methyltransferase, partial [Clostridiales bacterium]|nr:homocysteine methyltransferase [Clostridiales bacterium]